MHFFEDKLCALGRALDRACERIARPLGLDDGPTISDRVFAGAHAAGESVERARSRWAIAPENDRRRWLWSGVSVLIVLLVAGAVLGAWPLGRLSALETQSLADAAVLQQQIATQAPGPAAPPAPATTAALPTAQPAQRPGAAPAAGVLFPGAR